MTTNGQAARHSQVKTWNEEYESLGRDTEKWESDLARLDHEELLLAEQRRDLYGRIRDAESRQQQILADMLERLETASA